MRLNHPYMGSKYNIVTTWEHYPYSPGKGGSVAVLHVVHMRTVFLAVAA